MKIQGRQPLGHHVVRAPRLLALLTLLASAAAARDAKSPEYGVETVATSQFVFRGIGYSEGPASQTMAWARVKSVSFYVWSNLLLREEPSLRRMSEIDLGISYERDWRGLAIEPGLDVYVYRVSSSPAVPGTSELSVTLSRPLVSTRVFTKQVLDVGSARGAYFAEAGMSRELVLGPRFRLEGAVLGAWSSARYNQAYSGSSTRAFHHLGLELSLTRTLSSAMYLTATFGLTRMMDRELRERSPRPDLPRFALILGVNVP